MELKTNKYSNLNRLTIMVKIKYKSKSINNRKQTLVFRIANVKFIIYSLDDISYG